MESPSFVPVNCLQNKNASLKLTQMVLLGLQKQELFVSPIVFVVVEVFFPFYAPGEALPIILLTFRLS
jgi:hypothetical protein